MRLRERRYVESGVVASRPCRGMVRGEFLPRAFQRALRPR